MHLGIFLVFYAYNLRITMLEHNINVLLNYTLLYYIQYSFLNEGTTTHIHKKLSPHLRDLIRH